MRLRTASHLVMEISCNGTVLASRAMGAGTLAQRSGSPLRSGAYLPLDVSRVRGDGVRVLLDADGGEDEPAALHVAEELLAPLYAPDVTWRFGVGARSGHTPAAHQVDSLLLTSAAFVGQAAVAVRVANNAQQFSGSAARYDYYAPPQVAALCPSTGPRGGDTRVVISGPELNHGADPYCRFPVDGRF